MYGVTKVAGELLCDYYFKRFGVDTRGVRFPGIISNGTLPGGGTTDYAVEIFYAAIKTRKYTCFLKQGTSLDMMYMPDAIKAAIRRDGGRSGEAQASEFLQRHGDAFHSRDARRGDPQAHTGISRWITASIPCGSGSPIRWPNYMDDSAAREEWGWKPDYDLAAMTTDMIRGAREKHEKGLL